MVDIKKVKAPSLKVVEVSKEDLPLCCPTPEMTLWNNHPRVYLPIEKEKEVMCYYCGTKYSLV